MNDLNKLLNKVYSYYPKFLTYDSLEYKNSAEHLNLLKKQNEANNNLELKSNFKCTLENIFKECEVIDWTLLEEYPCYEFKVLLHRNQPILDDDTELMKALGNKRLDVHLLISVLEKFYYFYIDLTEFNEVENEWKFTELNEIPNSFKLEFKMLDEFFKNENYIKMPLDIAKTKVSDIETELKSFGDATYFNCFFTDLFNI